jgi:hypothetical protein
MHLFPPTGPVSRTYKEPELYNSMVGQLVKERMMVLKRSSIPNPQNL